MPDFQYKLQSTIAMIYGDPEIQAILKREAHERWLKQARTVVPRGWHFNTKRRWNMKRGHGKAGRPRVRFADPYDEFRLTSEIKSRSQTPLCDEVVHRHRADIIIEQAAKKMARKREPCACATIAQHWLICGSWVPFRTKEAA